MKFAASAALLALACGPLGAGAGRLAQTPVARVVTLIRELEAKIQADGTDEQKSYDKYACWCEATLGRKANDISAAKELIVSTEALIKELTAAVASHGAEIKQLKVDIAGNVESQREARENRQKEAADYHDEKSQSEQCIGALEAAIKVLAGAGTGRSRGFLETLQEAQLLSVAAGVRGLLANPKSSHAATPEELQLVRRFAEKPEDFVSGRAGGVSAAQIANNPFGDYAPQSTQIQGILKAMYDSFAGDLEKDNAEEAEQQKAFEALMATKQAELQTLEATLEKQNLDKAQKVKKVAESGQLLDDTRAQLEADERFFATAKEGCQVKATEWSGRTRLRTEELNGISQAIQILSSPEAQQTFLNATTTFLQVSAGSRSVSHGGPGKAYARLQDLAARYRSMSLAAMAVKVKAGGHFDKVIASIDQMVALLRREEQADILHRDRCQGSMNKNKNDMEDLNHAIDKSNKTIERMASEATELETAIRTLEGEIAQTKADMAQQLAMRNGEHAEFVQALKDDSDAVALLDAAIVTLSRFYKRNRIPMALLSNQAPEYTVDPDKAPETIWSGPHYAGLKSESEGILAILAMIKEDLEKEVQTSRADDAKAQEEYEAGRAAGGQMLSRQGSSKVSMEKELAELKGDKLDMEEHKGQKEGDLAAESLLEGALYNDCSWIETHFDTRRDKRKDEIDGLVEAKGYLAGVESGDQLAP